MCVVRHINDFTNRDQCALQQMSGTQFNHACNDVALIQCCNRLMKSL